VIATAFRDAGFEVIYTGLHQTPEMIADAAIQEDVDIVSISVLSGAHMTIFPRILELLRERGAGDMHVIGGGIIPAEDARRLVEMGVGAVFGPGTPTTDPIRYIRDWFARNRQDAGS
jgi:methylmalonyl-CoA mutase C-terminal domain/subunit